MNKLREYIKTKRLTIGLYLAPAIAAFSIALVMLPGIKPHVIDSTANSSADVVIGQPDMNSNWINQVGYGKTLNCPGVVVCYDGKLFVADIYNNRVLIYNSIPTSDNAAADVVIGQPDMISNSANQGGSPAANTLHYPYGLEVKNGKLFIADAENNRVLIYNSIPTSNNASADIVIGQSDFTSGSINKGLGSSECAANTLYYPASVFYDGARLFVADWGNHRVLQYNSIPSSNNTSADVVIGQPDMISNTLNNGGISAKTLNRPRDIYAYTDTGGTYRLIIADQQNHRVLIYNSVPAANQPSAEAVIGQSGMDARTTGCSPTKLNTPSFVRVINGKLFLGDYRNQRILIYNSLPSGTGPAANNVLGQPDMTSNTINNGGLSARSFNYMFDFDSDGTKFLAADGFNNRILVFNSIPTSNFVPADVVVGQPDFVHNQANESDICTAISMWRPDCVFSDGTKLFVVDYRNNRVLIYNSIPTGNDAVPDVVIGQPDFTSNSINQGGSPGANTLGFPTVVYYYNSKLFIADQGNHRVLIYNTIPTTNNASADVVIGQPDFTHGSINQGGSAGPNTLNYPMGIYCDGTRLFIGDFFNHRVLIFNTVPTTNNASANVVIGQPDFMSNLINQGGSAGANTLSYPEAVYGTGTKLFISDRRNNRVLIYNAIPASNNAPADVVIGQPDFTSIAINEGGSPKANTMFGPEGIYCDGERLFISDQSNHRMLIYNTIPTSNNASAGIVLGQPDMNSNSINQGGNVSSKTLYYPQGVYADPSRLFIADEWNNRILIYNLVTTKPVISEVKFDGSGYVSGDTIRTTPVISAKMTDTGGVGGIYINNLKITVDSTLYTYASFDATTDSYNSTTGVFTFKVKNTLATGTHNVKIEISDYLGNWGTYEATNLNVNDSSGSVSMDGIPLNYPNPFNTAKGPTTISYRLTVDSDIIVYVFDVRGVLIRKSTYSSGSMGGKAGYNEITWDGKDDFGSTVGNGIYPYRIVAGGRVLGRGKIAVLD